MNPYTHSLSLSLSLTHTHTHTHTHEKHTRATSTSNEHEQRARATHTSNEYEQHTRATSTGNEHDQWARPMSTSDTHEQRAMSTGNEQWARATSNEHEQRARAWMDLCTLDFRGCSRSFVSLLHVVPCPSRTLSTCPILTSGDAGLFRTQLQVCALENIVFWGVTKQDPWMNLCTLHFRGCSRPFVSLLHVVPWSARSLLTCPVPTSGDADLFRTQSQVCVYWKMSCFGGLHSAGPTNGFMYTRF